MLATPKEPTLTRLLPQYAQLVLAPNAPIDLHMHTTYSDGRWPAPQLIDYLVTEGFALVSVTDHDRVDKVREIQELGAARQLPVLSGVEISTQWGEHMAHMLCYGFDPQANALSALTEKVTRLQLENTYAVNEELRHRGYNFPRQEALLHENGGKLRRPADNIYLLREHGYISDWSAGLKIITDAGFYSVKADMVETVEAAHASGALCLIAHPGRRERSFTYYDTALLDRLRAEIPLDGIEVYHPYHSAETIATYEAYVRKHDLLYSTGSDSHGVPNRLPIKHRAEISRKLLERLGITIASA
jgi:predicted metal-dependent phosphoesterase TrpH